MRLLALPHRWAKRPEPGHGNLRLPDRPALLARRASSRRAGQTCSVRKGRIRLAIAFASATPLAARAQWRPSSRQLAPTPASPPASVGGRRPVGPGGEADARSTPRQQHRRRANACSEAVAAAPHDCFRGRSGAVSRLRPWQRDRRLVARRDDRSQGMRSSRRRRGDPEWRCWLGAIATARSTVLAAVDGNGDVYARQYRRRSAPRCRFPQRAAGCGCSRRSGRQGAATAASADSAPLRLYHRPDSRPSQAAHRPY